MKSIKLFYITISITLLGVISCLLMSFAGSQQTKPELPIMQSFSATPRFENTQTIFGQKIDLSRYDLHERFERELTNICYTHNSTILTIKKANRLFPIIIPILKEEGVPEDFIYLCCIESNLNQRAKSPAGAAGLWQFMSTTARQYGLTVNDEIDERYNTVKATHAACKYLKEAYAKFGDWMNVAASYNAGQGGIANKLTSQKESRALDLFLIEETSRYMFRIMAYKELMRDPYRYGYVLYSDQLYRPIRTRTIKVTNTISDLADFAQQHKTTYLNIKEFNPWLRDKRITFKKGQSQTYDIEIPLEEDLYYDASKPFEVYNKNWIVDK